MAQHQTFFAHTQKLADAWGRMSNDQRALVADMQAHYVGEIRRAADGAEVMPEGLAGGLHDLCDELVTHTIAHAEHGAIQCRKGCSHCCRLDVTVTAEEARSLVRAARGIDYLPSVARLQRQAQAGLWADLSPADRRCVFLNGSGECEVYAARPLACRKYFVASAPEQCDAVQFPGREVKHFVSIPAEVLTSAAYTTLRTGRLAQMVLKEMAAANDPDGGRPGP